jgi:hypothetical protein
MVKFKSSELLAPVRTRIQCLQTNVQGDHVLRTDFVTYIRFCRSARNVQRQAHVGCVCALTHSLLRLSTLAISYLHRLFVSAITQRGAIIAGIPHCARMDQEDTGSQTYTLAG